MARMSSLVISLAAVAAVCAAAMVAMKISGPGWRAMAGGLVRLVRSDCDHPKWEVLMQ
ncbi:MAG TPA: hypothetical protein VMM78_08495 [Thermomicrobiales bacterium]|nr:hypothetical protein [Thermomicrobiales bacterium]